MEVRLLSALVVQCFKCGLSNITYSIGSVCLYVCLSVCLEVLQINLYVCWYVCLYVSLMDSSSWETHLRSDPTGSRTNDLVIASPTSKLLHYQAPSGVQGQSSWSGSQRGLLAFRCSTKAVTYAVLVISGKLLIYGISRKLNRIPYILFPRMGT